MEFYSILRTLAIIFLTITPMAGYSSQSRILHMLKTKNVPAALNLYYEYKEETGQHDLDLIQEIGFTILEEGNRSNDPEAQLLTLFGAGISGNDHALCFLEEGIRCNLPQFQIVAINFLARFQNDSATELINAAMNSHFLPIRLEAALNLARNRSPKAPGQIEALMQKVTPEVLPVFPPLLAMCGDKKSINALHKLLTHPSEKVRIEAILATAKYGRDDLLPEIRRLSTHLNPAQQEACAVALGVFKDEDSAKRLTTLSQSSTPTVKLAALYALYQLGRHETRVEIEKLATQENLFAITLLGEMPGSENTLIKILNSPKLNCRVNASVSLLKLHHTDCLKVLPEIFIKDKRDLAFTKQYSFGKGLYAWKVVPSARQNFSDNAVGLEVSLHMREELLADTLALPEEAFISLAHFIFENHQNDLVPVLTRLLTNLQSPDAIQLLKYHREKVGAPLIRNYCNLALYKIKEPGSYAKNLRQWVTTHHNHGLIQFRPMIPWEFRNTDTTSYQLTPEDASRLLVESFESLVQSQDDHAIDILLGAIQHGNKKNRYALAGLLMRAAN